MASGQAKKMDERWFNSVAADGKAVGCVLPAPVVKSPRHTNPGQISAIATEKFTVSNLLRLQSPCQQLKDITAN